MKKKTDALKTHNIQLGNFMNFFHHLKFVKSWNKHHRIYFSSGDKSLIVWTIKNRFCVWYNNRTALKTVWHRMRFERVEIKNLKKWRINRTNAFWNPVYNSSRLDGRWWVITINDQQHWKSHFLEPCFTMSRWIYLENLSSVFFGKLKRIDININVCVCVFVYVKKNRPGVLWTCALLCSCVVSTNRQPSITD